jgi:succinate dehydrogenase / fumarate reductase flavoprotein subunit
LRRFPLRQIDCEVLVVGAGGAGLRAALAAANALPVGRVVIATKGKLGRSGVTALSCSDRMAFHATLPHTEPVGPKAWTHHADDICRIGGEVSDWDLAQILARGSAEAFAFLDTLGVPFVKKDGRADQFLTDGSRYARACYTGPYTANHIEQALLRRLGETAVQPLEECTVVDLLLDGTGERVAGALALVAGEAAEIRASAVVLATGGAGRAWARNVFPKGMTGDGYALAYRAGCPVVNMEFIQIGLCNPTTQLACSGSMMRALPRVINDLGEEFLPRYFPGGTSLPRIHDTLFAKGASWPPLLRARLPRHRLGGVPGNAHRTQGVPGLPHQPARARAGIAGSAAVGALPQRRPLL